MPKPTQSRGHDKEIALNTAQTNTRLDEVIKQLQQLNERMSKVATEEQVRRLTAKVDDLEAAEQVEEGQITQLIEDLKANNAAEPDPALDALADRLDTLKARIAAIVPDEAPVEEPPAEEPQP